MAPEFWTALGVTASISGGENNNLGQPPGERLQPTLPGSPWDLPSGGVIRKYLFFCSLVKPENKVPIFPCPLHACSCAATHSHFGDCWDTATATLQKRWDLI